MNRNRILSIVIWICVAILIAVIITFIVLACVNMDLLIQNQVLLWSINGAAVFGIALSEFLTHKNN